MSNLGVVKDEKGEKWFKYLCSYTDDAGQSFSFDIWAKSHEDMARRLDALKRTATVDGMSWSSGIYIDQHCTQSERDEVRGDV